MFCDVHAQLVTAPIRWRQLCVGKYGERTGAERPAHDHVGLSAIAAYGKAVVDHTKDELQRPREGHDCSHL